MDLAGTIFFSRGCLRAVSTVIRQPFNSKSALFCSPWCFRAIHTGRATPLSNGEENSSNNQANATEHRLN
jgi:hypothetical protein